MLFGHLLTDTSQIFSYVRTYWSPEAVKRVTGQKLSGKAANGIIHLINSGSTTLDGTGQQSENGKPILKPFWKITPEEAAKCLNATRWCPAEKEYFRGGGFSSQFVTRGEMPITMSRVNIIKGIGPVLQIAEGYTVGLLKNIHDVLDKRTSPTWPTTWFVPILTGEGPFKDVGKWMKELKAFAKEKDKEPKKLYFFYTTCPKCAQHYGKNYVVGFAEIS